MGGVVWFEDDETGKSVQVSQSRPFPVTSGGGTSTESLSAESPVTYDSSTATIGVDTDVAGGVATLDSAGKLRNSQLPPLQPDVGQASSEAEMLALDVSAPAMAIRTDFDPPHVFMLSDDPATDTANWHDTGGFSAAGADPASEVGLTPTPGTAATYMRSDAAPAVDQSIEPVWTGEHTFDAVVWHNDTIGMGANQIVDLANGVEPQDAVTVSQLEAATADTSPTAYKAPVPVVLAGKTENQTVVFGGLRTVTWQNAIYDPHGILVNTTDFVVPDWATHARVTVQVSYSASGDESNLRLVGAQINENYQVGFSWDVDNMPTGTINGQRRYISALVPIASGDVITTVTRQYDGDSDHEISSGDTTWVQLELCPA